MSEPKYQKGDRVQIVQTDSAFAGDIGVVFRSWDNFGTPWYDVTLEGSRDIEGGDFTYPERDLALVAEGGGQ